MVFAPFADKHIMCMPLEFILGLGVVRKCGVFNVQIFLNILGAETLGWTELPTGKDNHAPLHKFDQSFKKRI